jgi:hypothetical protein
MKTIKWQDDMKNFGLDYEPGSTSYALLDKKEGLIQAAYHEPNPYRMLEAIRNLIDKDADLSDFDFARIEDSRVNKDVYYLDLKDESDAN